MHLTSLRRVFLLLLTLLTQLTSLTLSTPAPSQPPLSSHLPDFLTAPPPTNFTPPACRFASPTHLPNPSDLLTNTTLRTQ